MLSHVYLIYLFQSIVGFQVETNHLICTANKVTGFFMKCHTGLKWVKKNHLLCPQIFLSERDFFYIKSEIGELVDAVSLSKIFSLIQEIR